MPSLSTCCGILQPARGVTYIYSSEDKASPTQDTTLRRIEDSIQVATNHGTSSSSRKRPREEIDVGSRALASADSSKRRFAVRDDDDENRENISSEELESNRDSSVVPTSKGKTARPDISSNAVLSHRKTSKGKERADERKASAFTASSSASPSVVIGPGFSLHNIRAHLMGACHADVADTVGRFLKEVGLKDDLADALMHVGINDDARIRALGQLPDALLDKVDESLAQEGLDLSQPVSSCLKPEYYSEWVTSIPQEDCGHECIHTNVIDNK
ncbi:hypothetical protein L227DRAFT_562973 [Lentinus tigrinus ALCF2SS1-6]|uniref:Uncharacterized protein n=1 Tax=Lentinus tigrinus ALCF2SS1-6 TaxID=1328759 RepID=A0A5C2SCK6_9APHY|nr:hypothetical protein L227DRAFT_562973 [Lentinus tigrinus ALCF2SS1-6]